MCAAVKGRCVASALSDSFSVVAKYVWTCKRAYLRSFNNWRLVKHEGNNRLAALSTKEFLHSL